MKESWADKLEQTLQKEREMLDRLSGISESKTDVIVAGDIGQLNNMLSEEQPLLMQLEYTEAERQSILKQANLEGKTLSEVAQAAEEEKKQELLNLLDSCQSVMNRLKNTNDLNNKLVKHKIEYFNAIRGINQNNALYAAGGKMKNASDITGYIDKKV